MVSDESMPADSGVPPPPGSCARLRFARTSERVGGSSALVLLLGAGSIVGPLAVGWIMTLAGPPGFFWWLALVHAGIGIFALWRASRRAAVSPAEQAPYVAVPAQSSWLASGAAEEVYGEPGDERGH
jgi:hypothetical protein